MAEFNGAVSEEKTIVVITKIFLNLTKQKWPLEPRGRSCYR
jgi:hypothetical protein